MTPPESRRDPRKRLVSAWVDEDLKAFVRRVSEARGMTETDLIIELLENYRAIIEQRELVRARLREKE